MGRFSSLYVLLLSAFLVEGNVVLNALDRLSEEVKTDIQHEMTSASIRARQTAQGVLTALSQTVGASEVWLNNELGNQINAVQAYCHTNATEVKKTAGKSLWSCLQMARVVTDGVNVASGGFGVAADIMDSLDNFLESLTACIIGPTQTASEKVACYLSALGTIATGVAENIEQVEQYINVVKRDVSDINAAIALCQNQTLTNAIQEINQDCHY